MPVGTLTLRLVMLTRRLVLQPVKFSLADRVGREWREARRLANPAQASLPPPFYFLVLPFILPSKQISRAPAIESEVCVLTIILT